jgi:hypothetical protein
MFETSSDVWSQTVAMIARVDKRPRSAVAHAQEWAQPTVRVLDRATSETLTVSWCDSRTGHYGHQTWGRRIARRAGTCVLSGRGIAAGDLVYSPHVRGSPPANAEAMIIASCVAPDPIV